MSAEFEIVFLHFLQIIIEGSAYEICILLDNENHRKTQLFYAVIHYTAEWEFEGESA